MNVALYKCNCSSNIGSSVIMNSCSTNPSYNVTAVDCCTLTQPGSPVLYKPTSLHTTRSSNAIPKRFHKRILDPCCNRVVFSDRCRIVFGIARTCVHLFAHAYAGLSFARSTGHVECVCCTQRKVPVQRYSETKKKQQKTKYKARSMDRKQSVRIAAVAACCSQ